eukprot:CAMPEP_0185590252 /NCGR_PEP_ID=MMETSP0434-20130131/60150_1 /TAXON_ID=626734 ORGANISM="Favella taraikaensis, Strain Fe Narragansett Bay" /NCGR_SAMPLE_ID=MMETSP0434 /ASSEMBLY_ACC=CAM_ASM_000379 /LENGTH=49 /DNA_ID=CAMNT_0028214309 /DNA_START=291 /DNA_END=440 /DNA_ORIENTATION=+
MSKNSFRPWDWQNHAYPDAMDRMVSMVCSVHMDVRDQANLTRFMWENSD